MTNLLEDRQDLCTQLASRCKDNGTRTLRFAQPSGLLGGQTEGEKFVRLEHLHHGKEVRECLSRSSCSCECHVALTGVVGVGTKITRLLLGPTSCLHVSIVWGISLQNGWDGHLLDWRWTSRKAHTTLRRWLGQSVDQFRDEAQG